MHRQRQKFAELFHFDSATRSLDRWIAGSRALSLVRLSTRKCTLRASPINALCASKRTFASTSLHFCPVFPLEFCFFFFSLACNKFAKFEILSGWSMRSHFYESRTKSRSQRMFVTGAGKMQEK